MFKHILMATILGILYVHNYHEKKNFYRNTEHNNDTNFHAQIQHFRITLIKQTTFLSVPVKLPQKINLSEKKTLI